MITDRRSFIAGALGFIAAPAIVKIANIMPVRGIVMDAKPQLIFSALSNAMGDPIGPFRYVTMRAANGLAHTFDYGQEITMQPGDTFTLDLSNEGMRPLTFNHNEWQIMQGKYIFTLS